MSKNNHPEAHSEANQLPKMEDFAKIVNDWDPLTIIIKSAILDVWLNSEHAFDDSWVK